MALSRLAVGQTLTVNQLVDMEWKFGGEREQTPLRRSPHHHHHHQHTFISIAVSQALAQLVSCYSLFWFGLVELRRHRLTAVVIRRRRQTNRDANPMRHERCPHVNVASAVKYQGKKKERMKSLF